jgi:hypothetical protein
MPANRENIRPTSLAALIHRRKRSRIDTKADERFHGCARGLDSRAPMLPIEQAIVGTGDDGSAIHHPQPALKYLSKSNLIF